MTTELTPPGFGQRSRELLVGRDVLRLALRSRSLSSLPRGRGRPVLVVAGLGRGDGSLLPLRRTLTSLGHDARPADLGRVSDDIEGLAGRLGDRVRDVADETDDAVALVGWSIGGVIARETARDGPGAVRRVVTFGTPVVGGPSFTALAGRYTADQLDAIADAAEERSRNPIRVPVTAIRSPNDGVVTPAACIDRSTPGAENVEVSGTHLGMSVDPDVWAIVADRLARD